MDSSYSRVKLFVFAMCSRRRYYIFVGFIYGLEEKNWKSEVVFAVCRLPLTSCLTSLFISLQCRESRSVARLSLSCAYRVSTTAAFCSDGSKVFSGWNIERDGLNVRICSFIPIPERWNLAGCEKYRSRLKSSATIGKLCTFQLSVFIFTVRGKGDIRGSKLYKTHWLKCCAFETSQ